MDDIASFIGYIIGTIFLFATLALWNVEETRYHK